MPLTDVALNMTSVMNILTMTLDDITINMRLDDIILAIRLAVKILTSMPASKLSVFHYRRILTNRKVFMRHVFI